MLIMERHIVEILVILMKEYPEGSIRPEDFEPLANSLIGMGYTQNEIETALFWFFNRQEIKQNLQPAQGLSEDSFRVLQDHERAVITPKAYGYLLELHCLGLITLGEMDAIIERAVLMGSQKVDVEEIKGFVAAQIMEQGGQSLSLPGFFPKTPNERVH